MISWQSKKRKSSCNTTAKLFFTAYAWAKLRYLRDVGPSEVGGFGICDPRNPLLVHDIELVEQTCTVTTLDFDDESVDAMFNRHLDAGRSPDQFARVWIHTHPTESAEPSVVDEETFERLITASDWGAMFTLARNDVSYGRLQFNVGPRTSIRLEPCVDYSAGFAASDPRMWLDEYDASVRIEDPFQRSPVTLDATEWHASEWVAS